MTKLPEELAEGFVNQEDTGSDTFAHGLRNGFLAGYQAAKQWISVKEQLPEYDVEVLTFETGNYKVNAVSKYTQWWWDSDEGFQRNPTHWMPLPAAPKGEA